MKQFQRTVESFTCENCETFVKGNGYTNHCPQCLYSKHVDRFPGDRNSTCGGLMKPVDVCVHAGIIVDVIQECVRCNHQHTNKLSDGDNQDALITIMAEQAEKRAKGLL